MKTQKELELEYVQVRTDIRAHMTMIKAYAESIQKSKDHIGQLAKRLEEIQNEYKELGYAGELEGEDNEQSSDKKSEQ